MNILTIGVGAFGFAILKLLGENNKNNNKLTGYCIDSKIIESIKKTREHPYFFKGYKLPQNIEVIEKLKNISNYDLIIIAVPSKFVSSVINDIRDKIKKDVIILNLAKGINNETFQTIGEMITEKLEGKNYSYATLSGGMIAEELVSGAPLGADIGVSDKEVGEVLKNLFESENMSINISSDIKNIELYGSLKNIMAILSGYYTGKGYSLSTLGKYLSEFYSELKEIIGELGGNKNIDFGDYSLGGDIIATCFGNSRNREFGELLGKGLNLEQAIGKMKEEKKYVEGYEMLKTLYRRIENKPGFDITKKLYKIVFGK